MKYIDKKFEAVGNYDEDFGWDVFRHTIQEVSFNSLKEFRFDLNMLNDKKVFAVYFKRLFSFEEVLSILDLIKFSLPNGENRRFDNERDAIDFLSYYLSSDKIFESYPTEYFNFYINNEKIIPCYFIIYDNKSNNKIINRIYTVKELNTFVTISNFIKNLNPKFINAELLLERKNDFC